MANLKHIYGPEGFKVPKFKKKTQYLHQGDPKEALRDEIMSKGMTPPHIIRVGEFQRFAKPDKPASNQDAWLIYNEFEDTYNEGQVVGNAQFGYWGSGGNTVFKFCSKNTDYMSAREMREFNEQRDQMIKQLKEEKAEKQEKAAKKAKEIIDRGSKPKDDHKYLKAKQIRPFGIVEDDGRLAVPVYYNGEICSIQRINANGSKRFLPGGRTKSGYFAINGDQKIIYVTEGYATACSIHEATKAQVYVSFSCHNLYEVTMMVKAAHPDSAIIIAGDNDFETDGNPGYEAATNTSSSLNIVAKFPEPPHVDFNDLHVAAGIDEVRSCLEDEPEVFKEKEVTKNNIPECYIDAPGVLGDIVGYYNMTSRKYQPGFAVQTALAIASVVTARTFRTNKDNYTSLYLLNVGKSTTGKGHSKTIVEIILEAAEMYNLVAGEGYTAAGAVFSSLLDRPRHVAIIDEFAKYLQACQNKASGGHMAEAISILMQSITQNNGRIKPKNYSGMGLTAEKRRQMNDQVVYNPANTMLCMATPDDLFSTLNVNSIKDGFINRFIVCVSNVQRGVGDHKDRVDVPDKILHWISAINSRKANDVDIASEKPDEIILTFTSDALKTIRVFEQFCIDKQDELEMMGMDALPGRSNEMAMKISLISALARDPMATRVDSEDVEWAIEYVKHHMLGMIKIAKRTMSNSTYEADKKSILEAIRKSGEQGVEKKEMHKVPPFSSLKKKDLDEVLEALIEAELIFKDGNVRSANGRGRPSLIFKAFA
jgi:hypothetical protein